MKSAQVDTGEQFATLEIDVEEVKNDRLRRGAIESAIRFTLPEDLMDYYLGGYC